MSGELHLLPGAKLPVPTQPAEPVCTRLRELLALAEAGKIRAFAYAFVDGQGSMFDAWVSARGENTGATLITAVNFLHSEIVAEKLTSGTVVGEPR